MVVENQDCCQYVVQYIGMVQYFEQCGEGFDVFWVYGGQYLQLLEQCQQVGYCIENKYVVLVDQFFEVVVEWCGYYCGDRYCGKNDCQCFWYMGCWYQMYCCGGGYCLEVVDGDF